MNNSFEFSKVKLTKLKPGNSRIRYTDSRTPGLVLDVATTGTKTFRFRRKILNKEKVVTIGRFGEWSVAKARTEATKIAYDLDRGIDPNDDKRKLRESLTVAGLYQRYDKSRETLVRVGERSQKSLDDIRSNWKNHCKAKLSNRRIANYRSSDARSFLDRLLQDTSPSIHNKCLTLLKSAFNYAVKEELVSANPFHKIEKISTPDRKRYLKDHEVKRFFKALAEEDTLYQDICMCLILTGQRKSNVLSMEWSEIDFKHKQWGIPSSKMKTSNDHAVPLPEAIMPILKRRLKQSSGEQFVFPSERSKSGHITDRSGKSGFWRRITTKAGLYDPDPEKNLRVHDLRRTNASWMAMDGESLLIIAKILGHSDIKTTSDAYAHLSNSTTRASLNRVSNNLLGIANKTERELEVEEKLQRKMLEMDLAAKEELLKRLETAY